MTTGGRVRYIRFPVPHESNCSGKMGEFLSKKNYSSLAVSNPKRKKMFVSAWNTIEKIFLPGKHAMGNNLIHQTINFDPKDISIARISS